MCFVIFEFYLKKNYQKRKNPKFILDSYIEHSSSLGTKFKGNWRELGGGGGISSKRGSGE